jgi:hypothetical protein
MNLLRSRWSTMCVAVGLGCLLVCPAPSRAQAFVELGGGWNYAAPPPGVASYTSGSNVQVSIGWQVAPNFRWRIDAFRSQVVAHLMDNLPCPMQGCPASAYFQSERVDALTVNGLLSLDQRGIFYLIGGAGHYELSDINVPAGEGHFGVSAGAGIAVPVAPRLRAVVEARWHGLFGTRNTNGPTSLVPLTVGLRF